MPQYSNIDYWPGSHAKASRGLSPREHDIPQGTILYRFIDIKRAPLVVAADSPWWLEFEYYQKIKHFAQQHGYPMGYCARLFAAIFYEWSEVNAVVRAEVAAGPLKVWKGKGKQVELKRDERKQVNRRYDKRDVVTPRGFMTLSEKEYVRKMTPMQGQMEVLQLFIPGLGDPHNKFDDLMTLLGTEQIRTG